MPDSFLFYSLSNWKCAIVSPPCTHPTADSPQPQPLEGARFAAAVRLAALEVGDAAAR